MLSYNTNHSRQYDSANLVCIVMLIVNWSKLNWLQQANLDLSYVDSTDKNSQQW